MIRTPSATAPPVLLPVSPDAYRKAKRCAFWFPLILIAGTMTMILGGIIADGKPWRGRAQRVVLGATVLTCVWLGRHASFLKTKPYRTYKTQCELEAFRNRRR